MKKITVLLFFAFYFALLYAQDENKVAPWPEEKNWHIELNFMPWDTQANNVGIDQLTVKYKITDRLALRMGIKYHSDKQKKEPQSISNPQDYYTTEQESKQSLFGLMPGLEFHFIKASRISPYVGIEFSYIKSKSYYKSTSIYHSSSYTQTNTLEIDGGLYDQELIYYSTGSYYRSIYDKNRAYQSIGINVPLGVDVYICKNFYMGVELGLNFNRIKYGTISITESSNLTTNNREIPEKIDKKFGIYYNNAIRIGVWF